jgi:hypothetical protein
MEFYPFAEMKEEERYAQFGQLNSDERHNGFGKTVITDYGVAEGQFVNGCLNGFGRWIFCDGTYHVGWWRESFAWGYGIGNAFSKADEGVKEGLWERDRLISDPN